MPDILDILRRLALLAAMSSVVPSTAEAVETGRGFTDFDSDDDADVDTDVDLDAVEPILAVLATDGCPEVRASLPGVLARLLPRMAPLQRVQLLADWASSSDARLRETVARVVASPGTMAVGELSVIEHLLRDESPAVRRAIRESLISRGLGKRC